MVVPVSAARFRYGTAQTTLQIEELNREMMDAEYEDMLEEQEENRKIRGTSETIQESEDYRLGSRTMHPMYEAPNKRLKEYKRKCIDLED